MNPHKDFSVEKSVVQPKAPNNWSSDEHRINMWHAAAATGGQVIVASVDR